MLGTGSSSPPPADGAPGEVQEASGMTLTEGSSRWCSRLRGDEEGLKMVSPGRGCERCLTNGGGGRGGGAADDLADETNSYHVALC